MNKHVDQTVGGLVGHISRRLVHVAIAVVPLLYYAYAAAVAAFFHLTIAQLMWLVIVVNALVEALRLKLGWTFFGHRRFEARRITSFAWGVFSICLVLLYAPGKQYAIPIIWSCALGDPLLGEMRAMGLKPVITVVVAIFVIAFIWWVGTWWLATAWWWALVMAPLIVACEWPNWRWIDDNALMQLVPLVLLRIVC